MESAMFNSLSMTGIGLGRHLLDPELDPNGSAHTLGFLLAFGLYALYHWICGWLGDRTTDYVNVAPDQ